VVAATATSIHATIVVASAIRVRARTFEYDNSPDAIAADNTGWTASARATRTRSRAARMSTPAYCDNHVAHVGAAHDRYASRRSNSAIANIQSRSAAVRSAAP
jgi:hypothetical protein